MHEVARHTIHSSETLEIAMETLLSMIQEHEMFFKENQSDDAEKVTPFRRIRKSLQFQSTILKCLHLRSKAIEERLRNEINLVSSTCIGPEESNLLIVRRGVQHGRPIRQPYPSAHRRSNPV
jgi:hypothetical protein